MTKFKRLSFTENQNRFPLMNEEAQRAIRGGACGCGHCADFEGTDVIIYDSLADYNNSPETHGEGGFICGQGYIAPVIVVYSDGICPEHNTPLAYGENGDMCATEYFDGFDYCDTHKEYFSQDAVECYSCVDDTVTGLTPLMRSLQQ